jgi:hypothetical protein
MELGSQALFEPVQRPHVEEFPLHPQLLWFRKHGWRMRLNFVFCLNFAFYSV